MGLRVLASLAAAGVVGVVAAGCGGDANALANGIERLKQGDARRAADLLELAARRHPESATAHANLGVALWRCGRPRQALTPLRTAAALVADDPRPKLLLGTICLEMGRLDDAYAAFDAARNTAPDGAAAKNGLGVVEYRRGQFGKAASWFQSALNAESSHAPALYNLAITLRTNATQAAQVSNLLRRYAAVAGDDPHADEARRMIEITAAPAPDSGMPQRPGPRRSGTTTRGSPR
jgi:Flp pilus assembly protein TadD